MQIFAVLEIELVVISAVSSKVSSERIQRRKGSLTKKRTSSRTLTSISSSEPDLVSLSDAFRVSRITNLEGNGL